jgi:TFIIF-interacting CTD phosphatase-like protein
MKEYADPVIDWLDAGQDILGRRFFREVRVTTSPIFDYLRRKRVLT